VKILLSQAKLVQTAFGVSEETHKQTLLPLTSALHVKKVRWKISTIPTRENTILCLPNNLAGLVLFCYGYCLDNLVTSMPYVSFPHRSTGLVHSYLVATLAIIKASLLPCVGVQSTRP
jgi:hypothetical protein